MKGALFKQIVGVGAVLGAAVFCSTWFSWQKTNLAYIELLLDNTTTSNLEKKIASAKYDDKLPQNVKKYFNKVGVNHEEFHSNRVTHLTMQQKGTILLDDKLLPFQAAQHCSYLHENVGFLWDAAVRLPIPSPPFLEYPYKFLELPIHVRDVYAKGKGALDARLVKVFALMHIQDNRDIDIGELMRWLAEAPLAPTSLLPSEYLSWETTDGNDSKQSHLHFRDVNNGINTTLLVEFNDEHLISSIRGLRPRAVGHGFIDTLWEGRMWNYQWHSGMLVPTTWEAGWWLDMDKFDVYFRAENTKFDFLFEKDPPSGEW